MGNFPLNPKLLPEHNQLKGKGPNDHHDKFTEEDHAGVDHKGLPGVPIVDDNATDRNHIWSAYKLLQMFLKRSERGRPNGVASLDRHGKVPRSQWPNLNNGGGIVSYKFESTGYVKFSNGFMMQWSSDTVGRDNGKLIYFHWVFTHSCLKGFATPRSPNLYNDSAAGFQLVDRTKFYLWNGNNYTATIHWIALGY